MPGDPLVTNRPRAVADLALKYRLPTMFEIKEFAEVGGLMSSGRTSPTRTGARRAYVDKILKGAKPG